MILLSRIFAAIFMLALASLLTAAATPSAPSGADGFVKLFNGKNWDGWYLKLKSGDEALAHQVFAIDEGVVHVFDDSFPDEYELNTGENATHGMFYTLKKYSRYVFRFEYKWGQRIANNFERWQYDAGAYYHVIDDKIWPKGIEYQIRYDHTKSRNHTGDLIRSGTQYEWYGTEDGKSATYRDPQDGGIRNTNTKTWLHYAVPTDDHHALDGEWNQCEIIVMGSAYAIHKLNGQVVNMAFDLSVDEGIIGLQAETAEIFYRNIEIKEFDEVVPAATFLSSP
ncbi:DUF1080 domain-containing protein [Opitutaceae bacterium]|nr:DUF1080 domain-containing protein [bacterium]MDB4384972.1 DUF1080 domain-containing protein [Opitutaceae bacterium]